MLMYNKSKLKNTPIQQLTQVGVYNQQVINNLQGKKLDAITQMAVKLFNDNAQRNKLTNAQYNKAVEDFNQQHGLILTKKGGEYQSKAYYSYINYPFLDRSAVKQTMDNYRQFVHAYNNNVDLENKEITKYNSGVVKASDKAILLAVDELKKDCSADFTRDYNNTVESFNNAHGKKHIAKKRIQKIKYQHEITMQVLVGFYVAQLKQRNLVRLQANLPTSVSKNKLPKLKIDHRKLATHTIDGITRLTYCKKTAFNHVKRLREAGILTDYLYINQNKPISVRFSADILEILDGNLPKPQTSQNQSIKHSIEKNLPHNNDTTSTFLLKEKEIKDFLTESAIKGTAKPSFFHCLADSYKNTKGTIKEKAPKGRAEIRKILPDFLKQTPKRNTKPYLIAGNFAQRYVDEKLLAEQLKNGKYNSYSGLEYKYLQTVAQYTNNILSTADFKMILIQDFIKSSAKIWKNHNVYVGEWKKTINYLQNELFVNITNKETMIEKLREYRWKLNFARKWFLKNKVNALYPYKYFDKTRTKSNEIGFFGLHSAWKSHLKYKYKKAKERKQRITEANARKRRLSEDKKLKKALKKYENGLISYTQLYSYVQDNLPNEYLYQLGSLLGKTPNYDA